MRNVLAFLLLFISCSDDDIAQVEVLVLAELSKVPGKELSAIEVAPLIGKDPRVVQMAFNDLQALKEIEADLTETMNGDISRAKISGKGIDRLRSSIWNNPLFMGILLTILNLSLATIFPMLFIRLHTVAGKYLRRLLNKIQHRKVEHPKPKPNNCNK